ncbi:hypothetical protein ACVWZZ_000897 [Bradyrhizobium sp. LM6.10]
MRPTLADHRTALGADRLDVDRLRRIEHQPDSVATAERRRRRCDLKRESHAQAVAVAAGIDAGNSGLRHGRRLRRRSLDGFLDRILRSLLGGFLHDLFGRFGHDGLGRRSVRRFGRGSRRRFRCFNGRHGGRRFRLHLGLDIDLGFARDRLGRRRCDLAMGVLRLLGRRLFRRRRRSVGGRPGLRDRGLGRRGDLALVRLEGNVDDVVLVVAE